jgi:hypothetical protein
MAVVPLHAAEAGPANVSIATMAMHAAVMLLPRPLASSDTAVHADKASFQITLCTQFIRRPLFG